MSIIPTHQVDVIDNMVYFEEPTTGANPAGAPVLKPVPLVSSMNKTESWRNDVRFVLGKIDRHAVLKSKKENNFNVTYDLYDTVFFQYGTELPGGSGTIEKTLCFILPIRLNGETMYKRFRGCITDTVNISIEEYYTVDHSWIAQSVSEYMTEDELKLDLGLTTTTDLTFPPAPEYIAWTNLQPAGTTDKPLSINGVPTYCVSLNLSLERGPTPAEATANETFFFIKSGYRKITGSTTLYLTGKEIDTLFRDFTHFTLTYKLNDDSVDEDLECDITVTNTVITSISDGLSAGENSYVLLECNLDGGTFTVTAVDADSIVPPGP
jgi:hypothetical protein